LASKSKDPQGKTTGSSKIKIIISQIIYIMPEIYLDYNATSPLCKEAAKEMNKWFGVCSNPSSMSKSGQLAKKMIQETKKYILRLCKGQGEYLVVFTSGASESNCMIIKSTIESYRRIVGSRHKPHVITTAVEHKSILKCCADNTKIAEFTYIKPNINGRINPADIKKAIKKNTCLISVMYVNNETGVISPIREIGKIAKVRGIPFHTDAVQAMGKCSIDINKNNIAALSASCHKFCGPPGLGLLIISKRFIKAYDLKGQIAGTQQYGLRGGTENVPAIAGVIPALKKKYNNRIKKNKKMLRLKLHLFAKLKQTGAILLTLSQYKSTSVRNSIPKKIKYWIIILGACEKTMTKGIMPNTILLSIVKPKICNVKLRKYMMKSGITVSIGSACNTGSKKASHVLYAMDPKMPNEVKSGVIRVSMGDRSTVKDINMFVKKLITFVNRK